MADAGMFNRTRSDKSHLGCDGVLEYLAHKNQVSPNKIARTISKNVLDFQKTLAKYKAAYIHRLVLSAMGYSATMLPRELAVSDLLEEISLKFPSMTNELDIIAYWIKSSLTVFHKAAFLDTPIIHYSAERNAVELQRGQV